MCKVQGLTFDCGHYIKVRLSGCGGSRARRGRHKAACTSVPYLWLRIHDTCLKCQMDEWETQEQLRLSRAHFYFRNESQPGQPGHEIIRDLVNDLQKQYEQNFWKVTIEPSMEDKSQVSKVAFANRHNATRRKSLLSQEVTEEDVVIPDEVPFHGPTELEPIDYTHPLDVPEVRQWCEQEHLEEPSDAANDEDYATDFERATEFQDYDPSNDDSNFGSDLWGDNTSPEHTSAEREAVTDNEEIWNSQQDIIATTASERLTEDDLAVRQFWLFVTYGFA